MVHFVCVDEGAILDIHKEFYSAVAIIVHVHVVGISALNRANFLLLGDNFFSGVFALDIIHVCTNAFVRFDTRVR